MKSYCKNCHGQFVDEEFCTFCGIALTACETQHAMPPTPSDVRLDDPLSSTDTARHTTSIAAVVPVTGDGNADSTLAPSAPADRLRTSAVSNAVKRLLGHIGRGRKAEVVPDAHDDVLPLTELEKGWKIAGPPYSTKAYDCWPVIMETSSGEVHAVFTRYKNGALTTVQTYRLLSEVHGNATVKLYSFGTVNVGGVRADYDITAARKGQSLQIWLAQGTAGIDGASHLQGLLIKWLRAMREQGFCTITVTPADLWISESGDQLTLTTLGAVEAIPDADTPRYNPDLSNSALLTLPWAAPEMIERRVIAPHTEMFAVGQLLSAALFGDPQDHAVIRNGSVLFSAIDDVRLARTLMGLLFPQPEKRWSAVQFLGSAQSSDAGIETPPWACLRPGAASTAFHLAGESYWLAEDLISAAVSHWQEASERAEEILDWLEGGRFAGVATGLRDQLLAGRSVDWVLIRLCRIIVPDAPLVWRGYALDDQHAERSLIALAQRALADSDDAESALSEIKELFDADLRGAFTHISNE